jgi:hypothetical protein
MSALDLLVLIMAGAFIAPLLLLFAWGHVGHFFTRGGGSPVSENFLCGLFLCVLFGAFVGASIHERLAFPFPQS